MSLITKKTFWIPDFWASSTKSLSRTVLILLVPLFTLSFLAVHAQEDRNSFSPTMILMVSGWPTTLNRSWFHTIHTQLCSIKIPNCLTYSLICERQIWAPNSPLMTRDEDASKFLKQLLEKIYTSQRAMQRLLSMHSYTSLIECDSYLCRYYHYSTGFSSTMNCPYAYKTSLNECKLWALKQCDNISAKERRWLLETQQNRKQGSRRRRTMPWACSAGVLGIPRFFYTKVLGRSCE